MLPSHDWRRRAVIYQVYPMSFRDASGDGVGDLRGVIDGLDHIAALGADIVWLSPIFASPMVDNGYDVSDYRALNPLFGDEADLDCLIAEAAKRGVRIVLDIALNHTATAHPWFQAALKDPSGPYRDYYLWRDPKDDGPPNNWRSVFGGPAWTQPAGDRQYYLHLFDRTQADLNWENPRVREEIYAAMRHWLDRGIAGFRLDVVTVIAKPHFDDFADVSINGQYRALAETPRLLEHLREMRREVFTRYDCVAIGEAPGVDPALAARLVDPGDPMLDLLYHFDLVEPPPAPRRPRPQPTSADRAMVWDYGSDFRSKDELSYDRAAFKQVFSAWDSGIGPRGWNTTVLSNHDLSRIVERFGEPTYHWRESVTMLQTLVLLMRGTPFLYQGDEIGMTNCRFKDIHAIADVWAKTAYRLALESGKEEAHALFIASRISRDHARTPMQWSNAPHAGFCAPEAKPWLSVNPNFEAINIAAQSLDPQSPLAHARAVIALRRSDPLWIDGAFEQRGGDPAEAFVFHRRLGDRAGIVALNLLGIPASLKAPLPVYPPALANLPPPFDPSLLRPYEARVYRPE